MQPATRIKALSRQELYELVWSRPLRELAETMAISSNGLAKICDRLMIPYPTRGFWARPEETRLLLRPPLPDAPEPHDDVLIDAAPSRSRRSLTRLAPAIRREQMLDAAAKLGMRDGINQLTVRATARELGISETQAQSYFATRVDLLVALARREIAELERQRHHDMSRGTDPITLTVLSTLSYLRGARERGPLVQRLVSVPEVRTGLRAEREKARERTTEPVIQSVVGRFGLSREVVRASTRVLASITLRTGRLLAQRRVDPALAERLCLSIVLAGANSNNDVAVKKPPA